MFIDGSLQYLIDYPVILFCHFLNSQSFLLMGPPILQIMTCIILSYSRALKLQSWSGQCPTEFSSNPEQANQSVQNYLQIIDRWVKLGLILKSSGHWHSRTGVEETCPTVYDVCY